MSPRIASSASSRACVRVGEHPLGGVGHLAEVVRRDLGRHPDGDARAAVDEQVGEPARQHRRLEGLAVVVRGEVDRVLVDVLHHLHRQRRHPALGVPRRRGRVVAGAAEVPLALDERVAHRPVLDEPDEGVIDRLVAVRVVLPHDVTDDAAALVEAPVRPVPAVVHRIDHPAVHRLEPVTDVGERPADDDAHGVLDVRPLHLRVEVDQLDAVGLDRRLLAHALPVFVVRFSRRYAACSPSRSPHRAPAPGIPIRCRGSARRGRCAG